MTRLVPLCSLDEHWRTYKLLTNFWENWRTFGEIDEFLRNWRTFDKIDEFLGKLTNFWGNWRIFGKIDELEKILTNFWENWRTFEKIDELEEILTTFGKINERKNILTNFCEIWRTWKNIDELLGTLTNIKKLTIFLGKLMNLKKYYITIINELLGKLTNFVGNWRTLTNLSRWDCRFIDDPCEFKDTPAESLNWQRLTCEICSVWVVYCCDHVPAWWLFLASPMFPLRFLEGSNTTEKLHAKFGLHVLDTGSTHITWEDLI